MKSILRNLYDGNVNPWEQRNSCNKEHLEIMRKIEDEERYFLSKMLPDDCDRFRRLHDLYIDYAISEEAEIFSYSFAMGMLFMLDVMEEGKTMKFE